MSPVIFYLILVFFSAHVEFSFFWLIIALLAGGSETVVRYKLTTDTSPDGKEISS